MPYSENKKIGGLNSVEALQDSDNLIVEQQQEARRSTLGNLISRIFNISTVFGDTQTSDTAIVLRGSTVGKIALSSIIPSASVTNTMLVGNIEDGKLNTISTPGKVANSATTAATNNANQPATIVARDSSGNFTANIITASLAGTATSASNLAGGTANAVPYQSSAGSTSFLASTSNDVGKFLTSNGASSPPTWTTPTSTTTTATNLSGGSAGAIPYQSGVGQTSYTGVGTVGQLLTSQSGSAPLWTTATNTNTNNTIVRRDDQGNFAGNTITAVSFSGPLSGNASSATTAAQLTTGRTIAMTGDVSYTSPAFNGTQNVTAAATISNDAVTFEKMQNSAAAGLSVVGRSTNSPGDFAEINAGTDGHVLRRSGTTLGFGQVAAAGIANGVISAEKLNGAQTGSAPIYGCRAWVNFDATKDASGGASTANTDRFIRASGNVTKVTKTATGTFQVFFTTAMQDANYVVTGMPDRDGSGVAGTMSVEDGTVTSASFSVRTGRLATTSSAIADCVNNHIAVFR